eukprot:gi/632944966/ref/XP_007887790.1/ PREDICTED: agouti-related protein [Callorhinchus milii]
MAGMDAYSLGSMLHMVIRYWLALHAAQVVLTTSCAEVDELNFTVMRDAVARDVDLALVREIKAPTGLMSSSVFQTPTDLIKEPWLENILDPEVISNALEVENRSARSPRRCIRHLESCFDYSMPCCDPCATCYCRFFKAICYCRKIGNICHRGKN